MRYDIVLAPEAIEDLRALPAAIRAKVKDALEIHLRHEPMKVSRSRIKRLRGVSKPQFRLRVDKIRAFYDVVGEVVQVLAIVEKAEASLWLAKFGNPE